MKYLKRLIFIVLCLFPAFSFGLTIGQPTFTPHPTQAYVMVCTITVNGASSGDKFGYRFEESTTPTFSRQGGGYDLTLVSGTNTFVSNVYFYQAGVFDFDILIFVNNQHIQTESVSGLLVTPPPGGQYGCCSMFINSYSPGNEDFNKFKLDKATGKVVFVNDEYCNTVDGFECISFDPNPSGRRVVQASAVTFKQNWDFDASRFPTDMANVNPNAVEQGRINKWRAHESYVYTSELDDHIASTANPNDYKNYDRGTFDYQEFVWRDVASNDFDKWIKTSTVSEYDGNGSPVSESDANGINSGAIYGYNNTQMVGVVQNASYSEISFESFEETHSLNGNEYFGNGILKPSGASLSVKTNTDPSVAHTGNYALSVPAGTSVDLVPTINGGLLSDDDVIGASAAGYLVQVWVRDMQPSSSNNLNLNVSIVNVNTTMTSNVPLTPRYTNRKGSWNLYEVVIPGSSIINSTHQRMSFKLVDTSGRTSSPSFLMDDVRVLPVKAEMISSVYDNQFRLVASFDSQHYALIYQYDAEGRLVRKLKETAQGVVTISETQYNSIGVDK